MILSFACKETEKIFNRHFSKKLPEQIQQAAYRKMLMMHAARNLDDLKTPPSNCLELLKGDRKSQYSIRINKQWRICFYWRQNNIYAVEIIDYHS